MRRILAGALSAAAIAAAAPAVAEAIPVRNLVVLDAGENYVTIGARVFSPPGADGCGARYRIVIGDAQQLVRNRVGRVNTCRFNHGGGWTSGIVAGRFNVRDLPVGTYTVCVIAEQSINGGYRSRHDICRQRRI